MTILFTARILLHSLRLHLLLLAIRSTFTSDSSGAVPIRLPVVCPLGAFPPSTLSRHPSFFFLQWLVRIRYSLAHPTWGGMALGPDQHTLALRIRLWRVAFRLFYSSVALATCCCVKRTTACVFLITRHDSGLVQRCDFSVFSIRGIGLRFISSPKHSFGFVPPSSLCILPAALALPKPDIALLLYIIKW